MYTSVHLNCLLFNVLNVLFISHRLLEYSESSPRQDNKCMIPLTIELRPDHNNSTAIQYTGFLLPISEVRMFTCFRIDLYSCSSLNSMYVKIMVLLM